MTLLRFYLKINNKNKILFKRKKRNYQKREIYAIMHICVMAELKLIQNTERYTINNCIDISCIAPRSQNKCIRKWI